MSSDYSRSTSRLKLLDEVERLGLQLEGDYIQWDETAKSHPRQWSSFPLYYNIAVIIFWDFFTAAMSTVGTSASTAALAEFGLSAEVGYLVFTTSNILGEGLGGIIFPPISESFGRKQIYILSTLVFCLFTALTTVHSLPLLIIGRTVTGFVTGIPATIAPGSLEDMLDSRSRIWGIFAWTTASNTGLVLGPIASSYVTATIGWRWVFYIGTIVSAAFFALSFGLKESRPTYILQQQLLILQETTGESHLKIRNPDKYPTIREFTRQALIRPLYLLATEPIVLLCSVLNAIAFGLIYGLTEVLPFVYQHFGFSAQAATLAFIPILLGIWLSSLSRLYDQRKLTRMHMEHKLITPEAKLDSFAVAVPVLAAGLWIFAWTVPPAVHTFWIISMIGLVPIGFAANDIDAVLGGYLVDSYTSYAASAFAALALTRALVSAAFSLSAAVMFENLDSNIAGTVLAAMATLFCISPVLLLRYGKKLREKSRFANYANELELDESRSSSSTEALSTAQTVTEEQTV